MSKPFEMNMIRVVCAFTVTCTWIHNIYIYNDVYAYIDYIILVTHTHIYIYIIIIYNSQYSINLHITRGGGDANLSHQPGFASSGSPDGLMGEAAEPGRIKGIKGL